MRTGERTLISVLFRIVYKRMSHHLKDLQRPHIVVWAGGTGLLPFQAQRPSLPHSLPCLCPEANGLRAVGGTCLRCFSHRRPPAAPPLSFPCNPCSQSPGSCLRAEGFLSALMASISDEATNKINTLKRGLPFELMHFFFFLKDKLLPAS